MRFIFPTRSGSGILLLITPVFRLFRASSALGEMYHTYANQSGMTHIMVLVLFFSFHTSYNSCSYYVYLVTQIEGHMPQALLPPSHSPHSPLMRRFAPCPFSSREDFSPSTPSSPLASTCLFNTEKRSVRNNKLVTRYTVMPGGINAA